jgi:hypothetical protein
LPPHPAADAATLPSLPLRTPELGAGFFGALKQHAAAAAAPGGTAAGGAGAAGALLGGESLDFVAPDEALASLLAQAAQDREYSRVVHALLRGAGGCVLRVLPPAALGAEQGGGMGGDAAAVSRLGKGHRPFSMDGACPCFVHNALDSLNTHTHTHTHSFTYTSHT